MSRRARPPLPFATVAVALAMVVVFAAELAGDGQAICAAYGLVPSRPTVVSAFSSLFLHDPNGMAHIAGNLAVLLFVGARVEAAMGSGRFAALFFGGGFAGPGLHAIVDPTSIAPLVGCSGALFAVRAVAATLYGAPMLAFTGVLLAGNVWHAFAGDAGSVSFAAHCGGAFIGTAVIVLARLRVSTCTALSPRRAPWRPCRIASSVSAGTGTGLVGTAREPRE